MESKICTKCNTIKPISEFYKNKARTDGHCIYCKECQKLIKANEYKRNKNKYKVQDHNRRYKLQLFLEQAKNKPCAKCGFYHPGCMDFHHRDKNKKAINISQATSYGLTPNSQRLLTEIEKCDILCANCHRICHWEERQKER